jgi:adenylate cyclase
MNLSGVSPPEHVLPANSIGEGPKMTMEVLIVDDEPAVEELVRQQFRHQIRSGELSPYFARDGIEAISVLQGKPEISVIVTDINMPRMDGLTLLGHVLSMDEPPLAIVVSAYGDLKNIRIAMNSGAFDFLTKPVDLDDLTRTVLRAHEKRSEMVLLRKEREEALRSEAYLSRYFSPSVVRAVKSTNRMTSPSAEWSDATFVFTDLTDFLPLIEQLDPQDAVRLLADYLDQMIDIVFRHNGTMMKIFGDALQIAFGAPEFFSDHARRAVNCVIEMDAAARQFAARQRAKGVPFGSTRIGVHSGRAVIGNFGGARFFDYTAYGHTVNIASRLETANKLIGTTICISEQTVAAVPEFRGRPVGHLLIRGADEPIKAFEPCNPDQFTDAQIANYLAAYSLLETEPDKARDAFALLLAHDRQDALSAFHLGRLLTRQSGVVIRT